MEPLTKIDRMLFKASISLQDMDYSSFAEKNLAKPIDVIQLANGRSVGKDPASKSGRIRRLMEFEIEKMKSKLTPLAYEQFEKENR